jgi:hypothetical protein
MASTSGDSRIHHPLADTIRTCLRSEDVLPSPLRPDGQDRTLTLISVFRLEEIIRSVELWVFLAAYAPRTPHLFGYPANDRPGPPLPFNYIEGTPQACGFNTWVS